MFAGLRRVKELNETQRRQVIQRRLGDPQVGVIGGVTVRVLQHVMMFRQVIPQW